MMKISDLIMELTKILQEDGDLTVKVEDWEKNTVILLILNVSQQD